MNEKTMDIKLPPRRLLCNSPGCRLNGVEINPNSDGYFDSEIGRVVQFGDHCPACKGLFLITRGGIPRGE